TAKTFKSSCSASSAYDQRIALTNARTGSPSEGTVWRTTKGGADIGSRFDARAVRTSPLSFPLFLREIGERARARRLLRSVCGSALRLDARDHRRRRRGLRRRRIFSLLRDRRRDA